MFSSHSRRCHDLIFTTCKRACSTLSRQQLSVVYKERGDPCKVLQLERKPQNTEIPAKFGQGFVHVKMLAAAVNPADINMIQGVYPIKPALPAVGGNEGCGVVIDVGGDVQNLAVGDHVLPKASGWGTWRTHGLGFEDDFLRIPKDIPPIHAAMLSVNPCTAYRLLKDFGNLQPGDVLIQNGGNSGVAQCVIQLAKKKGIQTINIVRTRPNIDELTAHLKSLGADYIIVDHGNDNLDMKHLMAHLPKAKLALNCVGGKSSASLLKYLEDKGTMVTYGGMSKRPLMVPAGPLIFNGVNLTGFWMTKWNAENKNTPEYRAMWRDLWHMVSEGSLKMARHKATHIENFDVAIANAMRPFTTEKQIIVLDRSYMPK